MTKKIKIIIIDDSKFVRTLFSGLLNQTDDIEVIYTSSDPDDALEKIKSMKPDVITLDAGLSEMDGAKFLERLLSKKIIPTIIFSNSTRDGKETTLRALEIGAVDYYLKYDDLNMYNDLDTIKSALIAKIYTAINANVQYNPLTSLTPNNKQELAINQTDKLIGIAGNVGSVDSIKRILLDLPLNSPPILISLSLSEMLCDLLAERLNTFSAIKVHAPKDSAKIINGHAYLIPSNTSIELKNSGNITKIILTQDKKTDTADSMLNSIAQYAKKDSIGVIITGSGTGGYLGLKAIKKHNGTVLSQNKKTCVSYDLPKIANDSNLVDKELPLNKIAAEIISKCS